MPVTFRESQGLYRVRAARELLETEASREWHRNVDNPDIWLLTYENVFDHFRNVTRALEMLETMDDDGMLQLELFFEHPDTHPLPESSLGRCRDCAVELNYHFFAQMAHDVLGEVSVVKMLVQNLRENFSNMPTEQLTAMLKSFDYYSVSVEMPEFPHTNPFMQQLDHELLTLRRIFCALAEIWKVWNADPRFL